ncbi:MAG TPA: hypothetical protein VFK16_00175 [Gemmatimonadaceae bacterium]|jgi:hypothetical protein|nr:hypothetical protein [Gemmatimonadaceae bacterium]
MRTHTHALALAAALALLAAPASAQAQRTHAPADSSRAAAVVTTPASHRVELASSAAAGVRFQPSAVRAEAVAPDAAAGMHALPAPPTRHQSEAMMWVGGGAFVAGAIIGGDAGTVIMVGGAVVGLFGLFNFLQ